jgi:hypothetical protein
MNDVLQDRADTVLISCALISAGVLLGCGYLVSRFSKATAHDYSLVSHGLSPEDVSTVMPADGLETARRVLAASNDKVRTGTLDLSRFYTNEFVLRP